MQGDTLFSSSDSTLKKKSRLKALAGAGAVAVALSAASPAAAAPVTDCSTMATPIYQMSKPNGGTNLLTRWQSEADKAATTYGFTESLGTPFKADVQATEGLTAVHRLWNAKTGDFVWIANPTERATAVSKYGYTDQGLNFYAFLNSGSAKPGCVPVYRVQKGAIHKFTMADGVAALTAQGWSPPSVAFYAAPGAVAPPVVDTEFSFAVFGDTQTWTGLGDTRFGRATQWVVDNAAADKLDIRYVGHTGDFTNWGWLVPSQLDIGQAAMAKIDAAGLPFAITVGNHDTRAVGHNGVAGSRTYGGSAYVGNPECVERFSPAECNTSLLVRHTEEINARFTADQYGNVGGAFEPGKIDNLYQTFEAGGKKWLVLTLELWPRTAAVNWAKGVVAGHPDHNVIIQTHSYLEGNSTIVQNNGGYGTNTGQYVFDNLVKPYANVKAVFSGHTGSTGYRKDTGTNGNVIHSFLNNDAIGGSSNTVRIVTVDTKTGDLKSRMYNQATNTWLTQFDVTVKADFL